MVEISISLYVHYLLLGNVTICSKYKSFVIFFYLE
jgi:hypothetical protein